MTENSTNAEVIQAWLVSKLSERLKIESHEIDIREPRARPARAPGGGAPAGDLMASIERDFGGFAAFRDKFAKEAVNLFGSGWVWLAHRKDKLEILSMPNAGTPIADGASRLLLALDVWEHAYYVDYRNKRDQFVDAFLDHLANWEFAAERLRARSAKFDPAAFGQTREHQHPAQAAGRT